MKALSLSVLIAAPLTFTSLSAQAVTLKLAHNLQNDHVVAVTLRHMAKEVSELTNGKVKIRIYPDGQMGGPRQTLEMLQQGALDMTKISGSELEPFEPAFSIFSLPYLFRDQEHFNKVIYGPIGHELEMLPKKNGFTLIAAYEAGTRSFYAKKPIRTPADVKGLKIRVISTPTTNKMIELLGGAPAPIQFGEVYTALQQGVVDAAENNIPSYVQTRHVEIAKYYSEDEHTAVPDFLAIANVAWKKLTPDQQKILRKAARDSEQYEAKLWDAQVKKSRAEAIKLGATFVKVDKAAFRAAMKPLWDSFRKDPVKDKWLKQIEAVK
ncbi:TRAP transporter substrate-binding protein [Celerinatantimonas yamalensis]|uniref:TRAP transporter substrate-binding protein n=1 Tax=Celerinatantimonas yamalensis TaxID=559956 RepID=A0ABW9G5U5_9GAMM